MRTGWSNSCAVPLASGVMSDPDPDTWLAAALVEQTGLLADLVAAADPETPVPTCPEWTVRKLLTHVGRGHRWAATIVRTRSVGPVDPHTVADGKPPTGPDAAGWLRDGAQALLTAVAQTGADTPVWTFTGPRPAGWWVRRRLHETTAHRADATLALGAAYRLSAELGADGVSEWLDLLSVPWRGEGGIPPLDEGTTLHLHATDDGLGPAGEWLVRPAGGMIDWAHGHGKATVAVRGVAVDLFLAMLRRLPASDPRLQVLGDAAVFDRWLTRTPF